MRPAFAIDKGGSSGDVAISRRGHLQHHIFDPDLTPEGDHWLAVGINLTGLHACLISLHLADDNDGGARNVAKLHEVLVFTGSVRLPVLIGADWYIYPSSSWSAGLTIYGPTLSLVNFP